MDKAAESNPVVTSGERDITTATCVGCMRRGQCGHDKRECLALIIFLVRRVFAFLISWGFGHTVGNRWHHPLFRLLSSSPPLRNTQNGTPLMRNVGMAGDSARTQDHGSTIDYHPTFMAIGGGFEWSLDLGHCSYIPMALVTQTKRPTHRERDGSAQQIEFMSIFSVELPVAGPVEPGEALVICAKGILLAYVLPSPPSDVRACGRTSRQYGEQVGGSQFCRPADEALLAGCGVWFDAVIEAVVSLVICSTSRRARRLQWIHLMARAGLGGTQSFARMIALR
ncbi:hypothetical protein BDN71DRAFT_1437065 [Pleurotus eryngii]|uniref:Uncharacterized protein n=1 Tax=Pleurotus eryngii TaxID=5323 RepID=A0A9P5ZGR7_PLEER|nr:hypothetical protein BDN71DRAFT_1437065 [Pleurotus eryngii]